MACEAGRTKCVGDSEAIQDRAEASSRPALTGPGVSGESSTLDDPPRPQPSRQECLVRTLLSCFKGVEEE